MGNSQAVTVVVPAGLATVEVMVWVTVSTATIEVCCVVVSPGGAEVVMEGAVWIVVVVLVTEVVEPVFGPPIPGNSGKRYAMAKITASPTTAANRTVPAFIPMVPLP
jgi:hypothetical protein